MNLILLFEDDFATDGTVRLLGRRARHVAEVQRVAPGDELVVGRLGAAIGRGRVASASPAEVVFEQVVLDEAPPPPSSIELLLAMPRPKILRRVLQACASAGVKRLVLVNSARVEKSYFDSPLLDPEAVREQLCLGLEQGRDTVLPTVEIKARFRPFVEDELAALWPTQRFERLLAHPGGGEAGLVESAAAAAQGTVVAIGPEGGWVPFEVALLEQQGFRRFSLGPRILRVDVAVPFTLGQLEGARRRGRTPPAAG